MSEPADDPGRVDKVLRRADWLPATGEWAAPYELRATARRRTVRRRAGVASIGFVVCALVVSLLVLQPSSSHTVVAGGKGGSRPAQASFVSVRTPAAPAPPAATTAGVAAAETAFSVSLLRQLSSATPSNANIVVSPSSLAIALSMLELGARGDTEAQIAAALGTGSLTAEDQAAGWSALSAELAAEASGSIELSSANSLWLQHGLDVAPSFLMDLSRYFGSGVWQVDFVDDPAGATAAINAWVDKETHARIPTLFAPGQLLPKTVFVLANATYFKGDWEQPFPPATTTASFTTAAGGTETAQFLHTPPNGPLDVDASVGPGADVVQLPYVGGRFAAVVVMPTAGSISGFVHGLSAASLDRLLSGMQATTVDLTMPSLSLADTTDLIPPLQAMGMTDAFSETDADLSRLVPGSAGSIWVQDVTQKAMLDVTSWGTEAAAATGVVGVAMAGQRAALSITIDHPYLFLIRDLSTGTILFASQVDDPAAG